MKVPRTVDRVLLDLDDPTKWLAALEELKALGPAAAPAVPKLVKMAESGFPRVASAAIATLGALGPIASPSIPDLIDILLDPVSAVRSSEPGNALRRIGQAALGPLVEIVRRDENAESRRRAGAAMQGLHGV